MRRIKETMLVELNGLGQGTELQQLNAQELDRRKSLRNKMDKFLGDRRDQGKIKIQREGY
jgi:Fe-S cluster biosynthesis and repair protein YggX